jgi:hypothetical protein
VRKSDTNADAWNTNTHTNAYDTYTDANAGDTDANANAAAHADTKGASNGTPSADAAIRHSVTRSRELKKVTK